MQKLLIEVSHQDQIFVEDECTKKGYTLTSFFEMLLNEYRIQENAKFDKEKQLVAEERKAIDAEKKALQKEKEEFKKTQEVEDFPCDSVEDFEEKPKKGKKKKN